LRRLDLQVADRALPINGMLVTGPGGVRVQAGYPPGIPGRAIVRRDLDAALLRCAADSGAAIEEGVVVERTALDSRGGVAGLQLRRAGGQACDVRARLVIAADGRESRLARAHALARYSDRPRRWAVGAYFTGVCGPKDVGEMHVRGGHYIGVAPVPGDITNACIVTADRRRLRDPRRLLTDALHREPELRDRFDSAQMVTRPIMLGPLAVECPIAGMPGMLLAGDAAGFIDPMTGDGLRFALRGAELAALEALRFLDRGHPDAHLRLTAARRREFAAKWRFNRAIRQLAASRTALHAVTFAARVSTWPVRRTISYAGDLPAA
jgi:flavin-dependent dehydrogenase